MKRINSFFGISQQLTNRRQTYRDLIRKEAQIGGELFGPVPRGHRREFFCLDERTWVWHEEWIDSAHRPHSKTTRYEVHSDRVLKVQNGEYYQLESDEALNLYRAAQLYNQRVRTELYSQAV